MSELLFVRALTAQETDRLRRLIQCNGDARMSWDIHSVAGRWKLPSHEAFTELQQHTETALSLAYKTNTNLRKTV